MEQMNQPEQTITITAKTLDEAMMQILTASQEASEESRLDIVVELNEKSYTLASPLVLSSEQNPKLAYINLTLNGDADLHPTVTSCKPITDEYIRVEGKPYFKCQLKKDKNGKYPRFHDLYFEGKRLKMATSPTWLNQEDLTPEERGAGYIGADGGYFCSDDSVTIERRGLYAPIEFAKRVAKSESNATEMCMYVQWEHYTLRVTNVDLTDTKQFCGETFALIRFDERFVPFFVHGLHRANNTMNRITFFRNDIAFLTEKNTYVYDWNNGILYFIVESPEKLTDHKLMYPTAESLIEISGLSNVCIQNLTFTGVSSSYACDNGYYARLSNVERSLAKETLSRLRHAAIVTSYVRNFTVKNCEFNGIGCNAIQMCNRTVRADIYNNRFVDVAMSAVSIGNPTAMWEKNENQSYAISVVHNYFEHIAYDYPNAAVIFLGISDGSEIMHNTICGCAYSGIFGGWGWKNVEYELGEGVNIRDTEIAYNKISNFMELCRDGAAIYMTGANSTLSCQKRFNRIHDNFAFLTEDDNDTDKRGYYLDGASTNYDMYDNVVINCALPLFTQYHVPAQYTHHNTVRNIYSTTPIDPANHNPKNDVLLEGVVVETDGLETLFQKHPKAAQIANHAGCNPNLFSEH